MQEEGQINNSVIQSNMQVQFEGGSQKAANIPDDQLEIPELQQNIMKTRKSSIFLQPTLIYQESHGSNNLN